MSLNKFLLMHETGNQVVLIEKEPVVVNDLKKEAVKAYPQLKVESLQIWDEDFQEFVVATGLETEVMPKSRLKVIDSCRVIPTIILNQENQLDEVDTGTSEQRTVRKTNVNAGGWMTDFTIDFPEALERKLKTGEVLTPTNETSLTDIIWEAVRPTTVYPTAKQYSSIIEDIFRKYPLFATSNKDLSFENHLSLWIEKVKYKFQNMRRRDSDARASMEVKSRKRKTENTNIPKTATKQPKYPPMYGLKNYLPARPSSEDDTSIEAHVKWLQNEFFKKRPDYAEVTNRLELTMGDRRKDMVEKKVETDKLKEKYPWLFTEDEILSEFLRIHGSSQCKDLLKEGLAKHSSNLVHCYTTKKNNKDTAELLPKLASEEKDVDKEEFAGVKEKAALLAVPSLMQEDWKKIFQKKEDDNDNTSSSTVAAVFLQMDANIPLDAKKFTLLLDGIEVCSMADFHTALSCYIASFYVFHLEYPTGISKTLEFYQYALMGITDNCKVDKGVLQLLARLNKANRAKKTMES